MAKIKHTKNELKLQAEIQHIRAAIDAVREQEQALQAELDRWIAVFADPLDPSDYLSIDAINRSEGNVAGVSVPIFESVAFQRQTPDIFDTPPWIDDALSVIEKLITLRAEADILSEQKNRITDELHTTSQRVNLFEKVKIPETNENIRVIKIYLGDEQTAGVARAKIAKDRLRE